MGQDTRFWVDHEANRRREDEQYKARAAVVRLVGLGYEFCHACHRWCIKPGDHGRHGPPPRYHEDTVVESGYMDAAHIPLNEHKDGCRCPWHRD